MYEYPILYAVISTCTYNSHSIYILHHLVVHGRATCICSDTPLFTFNKVHVLAGLSDLYLP